MKTASRINSPSMERFNVVIDTMNSVLGRIPHSVIALLGRFSIAAVFWKSGQTKVEGLAIDIIEGRFEFGVPHFNDNTIALFREEYRLPLIPPEVAALFATISEHVFPVLLLFGLATRLSALALFGMTAVIEVFVYPAAYPVHGVWATVLLYLIARGGGLISVDQALLRYCANDHQGPR